MNTGVGKGGDGVSSERCQKDQGHDGVTEIIVTFELFMGKTWQKCFVKGGASHTYGIKAYNQSANRWESTVRITHSNCGVIHSSDGER